MNNRKGFTLTELLAVIAIMAILAVAAISGYSTMTKNSKKKTYESKVAEIENAAIKFAKETNLRNSTTISVNKLVVQGYFQPDESTANGISTINNPVNGDNMICNLVNITVQDDIYIAEYKEKDKDCNIANQELADANIKVTVRELNAGGSIGSDVPVRNSIADWTNKDVVVITSSSVYTDFVSVSYDFGGQTITKVKNTPSSNTRYVESDYNKVAIQDVKVMFNSEVTVTYNLSDGTAKSRTIIVRIDKEAPTSRPVISNDATVGSTKRIDLYLDDGSGSGVVGFYLSSSASSFPASSYIKNATDRPGKNHGDGKFNGYNSYFYAQRGTYYVKVVDAVGNSYITPAIIVANFEPTSKSCTMSVKGIAGENFAADETWYNKSIRITGTTNNSVGTMGVKYIVNHFASVPVEKDLKKYFDGQSNNGILTDYKDQTEESDQRTYYLAMKGQGRNEAISYCTKRLGVDKHSPTATLTCTDNDCGTYKKTHRITITLNDDRSGFYTDAFNIQIGWSTSNTTAPTSWRTLSGGAYAKKANGTNNEKQVVFTTSVNQYTAVGSVPLTGEYYMWVKGDSFEDKAHNKGDGSPNTNPPIPINFPSPFKGYYDNTPPTCTSSGGSGTWYNTARNIYGSCTDSHSGCVAHANSGVYSYDSSGKVTRKIDYEINSTSESPGEIYDKAGNHITCPGNQTVKIDLTKPSCTATNKTTDYNVNGASYNVHCTDALSGVDTCDGTSAGSVSPYDKAVSNKKADARYTVKDIAGNSNTCTIGVKSATFYRKSTRYWINCVHCHGEYVCTGGYYGDPYTERLQHVTFSSCAAMGGSCGTIEGAFTCFCTVTRVGPPYCHGKTWDACHTCSGDWSNWSSWSDWAIGNSCSGGGSDTCKHETQLRYKNS